ncbi:hypothetical protein BYT27DRAFT_7334585 [Phlegmacium glaucopus]|nr:hypothetical protein BYT27DRAFT_7334585 [Phlegmacium glaucopus]
MYLQGTLNKGTDKRRNIIFYALCVLYILSVVTVAIDIAHVVYWFGTPYLYLNLVIQGTLFACSDFTAQSILIYRCWIVWGCNIRVVILPSILAFVFLVMWLASIGPVRILSGQFVEPDWDNWVTTAAIAMSMTVNALVTCLIVFKIFKIKFWTVIFIVIESGMALFSIQLARLVTAILPTMDASKAFFVIVPIHPMFNGITPTIILVWASMGLSFHDKESIESTIGSLHFAANNPNSMSETETEDVSIVNRDDDIGVQ